VSLPSDQKITKLRIFLRRAEDEVRAANKVVEESQRARSKKWSVVLQLNGEIEQRAKELGYCWLCELPLTECKGHILLAAACA